MTASTETPLIALACYQEVDVQVHGGTLTSRHWYPAPGLPGGEVLLRGGGLLVGGELSHGGRLTPIEFVVYVWSGRPALFSAEVLGLL